MPVNVSCANPCGTPNAEDRDLANWAYPPNGALGTGGTGGTTNVTIPNPLPVTLDTTYDITQQCLVDDVAGDGTGQIVPFVRLTLLQVDNATGSVTSSLIGDFTDSTAATTYAAQGTARDADDVGTDAVTDQSRFLIQEGATWSPTADLRSYTIRVVTDTSGNITFTDSGGEITPLVAGETLSFDADVNEMFETSPVLTTGTGDVVVVSATKIGV